MEIARGDLVIAVLPGDSGKGRPALVVQSNAFNGTHASIVVCPITSHLVETPMFRIPMKPTKGSGLATRSQIMVDKITAIRRERIARVIGRMETAEMAKVDRALRAWLEIE